MNRGDRVNPLGDRGGGARGDRGSWQHSPEHRKGSQYRDTGTQQKFNRGGDSARAASRESFRGRAEQGRRDMGGGGVGPGRRALPRGRSRVGGRRAARRWTRPERRGRGARPRRRDRVRRRRAARRRNRPERRGRRSGVPGRRARTEPALLQPAWAGRRGSRGAGAASPAAAAGAAGGGGGGGGGRR